MKRSVFTTILAIALVLAAAGSAEAGWEEGVAALKAGNYVEAARNFQGVTEQHPEWPDGYFMLGQSLLKLKRSQEALTALRKAYDLKPSDVNYQYALGRTYATMNRHREAAELLGKVNPSSLTKAQQQDYHKIYAVALSKSGQAGAALQAMASAAQADPGDASAQFNYGAALFNAGRVNEALGPLAKAAQLDGKDPAKLKAYVDALLRKGRETRGSGKADSYQKATTTAKQLVAQKPTYENYLLLGEAQLGASQYTEAIGSFNQASSRRGTEWIPFYYIGQAHTANKSYRDAEGALQKALDIKPGGDAEKKIWKQLGFVYEKQKKYTEAEQAYNTSGDAAGVQRVRENAEIARHNQKAEEEQKEYEDLLKQEEEIKKQLQQLGDQPPRR